jgi:flagellar assembly protein FliH
MTQLSEHSVLLNPRTTQGGRTVSEWIPSPHAAHRADEAIAAAHAEGFAAGQAAAQAEAAVMQRRVTVARVAFETATAAIQQASADRVRLDSTELAELTYGLTEALVGRELDADPSAWKDAVSRALHGVEPTLDVTLRLHPTDAEHATDGELANLRLGDGRAVPTAAVRVVADNSVEPGGCVAEIGPGRIDAQIGSALQRVAAALGIKARTPASAASATSIEASA